jgi:hypothetical protein
MFDYGGSRIIIARPFGGTTRIYGFALYGSGNTGQYDHFTGELVSSQPQPISSIIVLSPNGGESFIKSQSYLLQWKMSSPLPDKTWIRVELRDAANWNIPLLLINQTLASGVSKLNWKIPQIIPDGNYLLTASLGSYLTADTNQVLVADISDNPFRISSPTASLRNYGNVATVLKIIQELFRVIILKLKDTQF